MKRIVLIAVLLLFTVYIFGQKEEVIVLKGTILQHGNNQPVSYASLHIKDRDIGTISDSLGNFIFEFEKKFQKDTLIVSCVGYKKYKERLSNINFRQPVVIELLDSLFILDEITALCYNNIEPHLWSAKTKNKTILMLSFAIRKIETAANFVKIIKEEHRKPKLKDEIYTWKKIDIKKFPVNKVTLTLATYTCSYCPLENEYIVAMSFKDKRDNNLLDNEEYKKFLIGYFQDMLDKSIEQGADFNEIEVRDKLAFLKGAEITYTGRCFSYYDNGQKGKVGEYKDGKEEGKWTWWFENGQIGKEVTYINGMMDGTCKWWFENGQLKRQSDFKDGKKNGLSMMYFPNGNKNFEGNFINDQMHGKCAWWYETGEKKKEALYENGVFKTKTEWDK
ncbi:MAG: carboxypeptidase-like regulatory domain-containing protein [Bacteroidia bacterium]|nr:carboxypeptidase-like regulatory domain-containing protein [Bacteroidia bacterium]